VQYQICHPGGNSLARCCGIYPRITASRRLMCWLGHPTWAHRALECFPNIVGHPYSREEFEAQHRRALLPDFRLSPQRVIDSESESARLIDLIVDLRALLYFKLRRRRITTPSIKAGLHARRAVAPIYSTVNSGSRSVSN
jgi:hypothetical protein